MVVFTEGLIQADFAQVDFEMSLAGMGAALIGEAEAAEHTEYGLIRGLGVGRQRADACLLCLDDQKAQQLGADALSLEVIAET